MSHRFLSLLSKVLSLPSKDTGRGVDFGRSQLPHRYVRSSSVVARSGSSMAMTKILYVEDNEDNVYMLVNRLRRHALYAAVLETHIFSFDIAEITESLSKCIDGRQRRDIQ